MRQRLSVCLLSVALAVAVVPAQDPAPEPLTLVRMRQIVGEAAALSESELQKITEMLSPVLGELRRLHQEGQLNPESRAVFQDALLLQMRTLTKLLVEEKEIAALFRELLLINPRLDDGIFNPREKLVLEKVKSAETGGLALRTTPPGAVVTYFGIELGVTPLDVPLIAGTYRLLLHLEGYQDQEFEAAIHSSEILTMERALRRRTVHIPVSINAPQVAVRLNGAEAGVSRNRDAWLASLSPEQRQELASAASRWNPPAAASFFLLQDVPVGEALNLEFRSACYQPAALSLTVSEKQVDWTRPLLVRQELQNVELQKDTGFVEITSVPEGAEVLLDGTPEGKTPLARDVCSGTHRVQVLHPAGQYVREVIIRRGAATRVSGEIKPAVALLGVYAADGAGTLTNSDADWQTAARHLALRMTAFVDPQLPLEEIRALRAKGGLPVERLLASGLDPAEQQAAVQSIASKAGHANAFLLGIRSGNQFVFRLYGTIQPAPDLIEVPNLEEASLDFLVSQIDGAAGARSRLRTLGLGLDLVESSRGLVILENKRPKPEKALAPGTMIRSVDQKQMRSGELAAWLRGRNSGQPVTLEIVTGKETASFLPITLVSSGAEYAWSSPDAAPNAVLAMMSHVIERDPAADEAKYAGLSLARGLMLRRHWKLALDVLARTNLEAQRAGVGAGTALYYQGRCHEELGDPGQAVVHYKRAMEYPEATMAGSDGILIRELAARRLRNLQKPSQ